MKSLAPDASRMALLIVCLLSVPMAGCASHAAGAGGEVLMSGPSAGSLDQGNLQEFDAPVKAGEFFMNAMIEVQNRGLGRVVIDKVEALTTPANLPHTAIHIYLEPRRLTKGLLPIAAHGWPPKGYRFVSRLPRRHVTVPPGRYVSFPFALQPFGRPSSKVSLNALRIYFTDAQKQYVWITPSKIVMTIKG